MIKIYYVYKGKISGTWYEDYKIFYTKEKALRFLYATCNKFIIDGWICEDSDDNDYLNSRFRPELNR